MKNKEDIIILCDELENCKKKSICDFNEIICAKKALREYINGDKNRILKLKVQLDLHKNFRENTFSQLAFCVSIFSLMISTMASVFDIIDSMNVKNLNVQGVTFIIAIFISFLIIMIMVCATYNVYTSNYSRQKWMKYIEYALQDIEKEILD
ncbi:MAG: hypothetical protein EGS63_02055 [Lachnospira sp.]|jgi:hypothetical protein|nr:hypothetical protein [Lachnospira sp.]DAE64666.1 MAG TPA: hypothetical protein [Caudoviricetes sp.]DAI64138.1 MAG TPA: hypothetical protein [Caudoviricetes sp.]